MKATSPTPLSSPPTDYYLPMVAILSLVRYCFGVHDSLTLFTIPPSLRITLVDLARFLLCLAWAIRKRSAWQMANAKDVHEQNLVGGVQLYTVRQVQQESPRCCQVQTSNPEAPCTHFAQMRAFLVGFLAKPHAHLGRRGPVCPFIPRALKKDTLLMGMVHTDPSTFTIEAMETLLHEHLMHLQYTMEPLAGPMKVFKSIVLGFPDINTDDAPQYIDQVQQKLKREFTQVGMMLGEFHKLNNTPGLHNQKFHPLQTPFPALAMRCMVPSDLVFLKHDKDYVTAYLKTIPASDANARYIEEAEQALEELSVV